MNELITKSIGIIVINLVVFVLFVTFYTLAIKKGWIKEEIL